MSLQYSSQRSLLLPQRALPVSLCSFAALSLLFHDHHTFHTGGKHDILGVTEKLKRAAALVTAATGTRSSHHEEYTEHPGWDRRAGGGSC